MLKRFLNAIISGIRKALEEKWMENIIALLAVVCTVVSIWIGVYELQETIRNESVLAQKATMLEQTKELPHTMQEFLRKASMTLGYKVAYDNEKTEEYWMLFEQYNEEQTVLLEELTGLLVAYGSDEAISIFSEFYYPLRESISDVKKGEEIEFEEWIEMYYSLPLLMSIVKYDTTGEIVNPNILLKFLMPEFETMDSSFMEDLKAKNDELVEKYELDEEFMWKE